MPCFSNDNVMVMVQTHTEVHLEDGTLFGTLPLCTSAPLSKASVGDDDPTDDPGYNGACLLLSCMI